MTVDGFGFFAVWFGLYAGLVWLGLWFGLDGFGLGSLGALCWDIFDYGYGYFGYCFGGLV